MVVTALSAAALLDAVAVQSLYEEEAAQYRSGRDILIADADLGLDAASCARLGEASPITAAGGVGRLGIVEVTGLPGSRIPLLQVTTGVLQIAGHLGAEVRRPDIGQVFVAPHTRQEYGLGRSDVLDVVTYDDEGVAGPTIDGLRPTGIADIVFAGARYEAGIVAVAAAIGRTDTCVVLARPGRRDAAAAAAAGGLRPDQPGGVVSIRPLLTEGRFARDLVHEFHSRPTRFAWLAVGLLMGVMWTIVDVSRRAEVGMYLVLGLRRPAVVWIRVIEAGLLLIAGGAAAAAIIGALGLVLGVSRDLLLASMWLPTSAGLLVSAATSTLGIVCTRPVAAADLVRDRT